MDAEDINALGMKPRSELLSAVKVGKFELGLPDPFDLESAEEFDKKRRKEIKSGLKTPSAREPMEWPRYRIVTEEYIDAGTWEWWEELRL